MIHGFFHIDLDAFFVSVEQTISPELRGKPVIVGGQPDRRGVVAAASYEARAFSIHSAMPLAKAYRLCPHAIFLQGNFANYREVSGKFMDILGDFSPSLEPLGLDEAYLDITGCDIFGTPYQIALKIKERVKKELHIIASIGIANCKIVAKIASDLGKPDGLVEVAAGQEKSFLAPLPIAKLPGIGIKTGQILKKMGIKTIGQFADLRPDIVKRNLGKYGTVLHQHANGIDTRRIEPPGEAKSISRETTFAEDTSDIRLLYAMLRYLCERVGAQLRRQNRHAKSISLKLRYSNFDTINRSRSSEEATNSDETIYTISAQMLDKALAGKQKEIRLIGVEASNFIDNSKQLRLFDFGARRQERLDRTIDNIRKKYGFDKVQTGRTLVLREIFESKDGGYKLNTPSLSR